MSRLLCLVLWSNWSVGVHILRDIAQIGWASQNWMNIFSFISSEKPEMGTETFRTVTIVFSTPGNLLVGISGDLGMKESHFLSKNVFWENAVGVSQKWWMLELSSLCHCVQHPWKLTSGDFWSSRNAPNTPLTPSDTPWHPQMATPTGSPGGSDLPDQNQTSDTNELCSSL